MVGCWLKGDSLCLDDDSVLFLFCHCEATSQSVEAISEKTMTDG
jgi:hypothetical protein